MFPRGFEFRDNLHARYFEALEEHGGLIHIKANRLLERQPSLDFDELIQIGRCILMVCLQTFDKSRGKPLHVYFGYVLDNIYRDHVANIYSPTRCPRGWVREDVGWTSKPMPAVFTDAMMLDEVVGDDDVHANVEAREEDERRAIRLSQLKQKLKPHQRRVLDALIEPTREVFSIARMEQGNYHFNKTHIAKALGMTHPQVEYAVAQIRRAVVEVAQENSV